MKECCVSMVNYDILLSLVNDKQEHKNRLDVNFNEPTFRKNEL